MDKNTSVSKTFQRGDELSDDGLDWFWRTLTLVSHIEDKKTGRAQTANKRVASVKFKITITQLD